MNGAVKRFWPLVAAILIAAVLRCYRLGANSLWVDEIETLLLAQQSVAQIVRVSTSVNFIPPLYFVLVHGVLRICGESEVALRLMSVVAGICTILAAWLLTQRITKSLGAANITAALLAVNPLHIWYSQEARPYALLTFLGISGLVALERAMRTGSVGSWVAFSTSMAAAFLTHTIGLMFALIAGVWVLQSSAGRRIVWPLLASSLAVFLSGLPFIIAISRALQATHGTFHSPPRPLTGLEVGYTLFTYVGGYSFGPSPREIQDLGAFAALRSNPLESGLACAGLVVVVMVCILNRRGAMIPFASLLGIPVVGILALSALSGKAYNVRYTLPAVIGFLGIVSIAALALKPTSRALFMAGLIGISLWADDQWYSSTQYAKDDTRAAVAWLRGHLRPGATIGVAPEYAIGPLAYYSSKTFADLDFVPLPEGSTLQHDTGLEALVLTRLHHVPNWRALKDDFVEESAAGVINGRVTGYEMLARTSLPRERTKDRR
jgi:4-amino-4-deoxy-L-arabinose transferase-like glycosyltransferase